MSVNPNPDASTQTTANSAQRMMDAVARNGCSKRAGCVQVGSYQREQKKTGEHRQEGPVSANILGIPSGIETS